MDYQIQEIANSDSFQLERVGRLRLEVWRNETPLDDSLSASKTWLEPLDKVARHWIAVAGDEILAAARLTVHKDLADNPEGYLWQRAGLSLPGPCADLGRLVVATRARRMGIGKALNEVRIAAARQMEVKSIVVTASLKNSKLLCSMGFVDTGIEETFANRPGYVFKALHLIL